jgi:putative zinc finger protein
MKQSSKNEVDILLRSLARERGDGGLSNIAAGNGGGSLSNHLDADELNSYAEGVLPDAARARYTEHLADCDDCRGLIVGLSQASGAAIRRPIPEGVGTNFWQKLAALFSPAVIRFAVPALVLTVVMGIGLMAFLRQRQSQPDLLARNVETNQKIAPALPEGNSALPGKEVPSTNGPTADHTPGPTGSTVNSLKTAEGPNDKKTRDADQPLTIPESEATKATAAKDDGTGGARAGLSSQPYALEPGRGAAAPPPPATKMGEMPKAAEEDRVQAAAKRDDQNASNYEFKSTPNDEHGPSRAAQRNNSVYQQRERAEGTLTRGPSGLDKGKNSKEVESRTVAGRRFVRDGDAWVDTAYDSSRATTKVARGSDQFRALVADEPGIRTIAEQLDGVVIVVWKGRAYRIQ